MRNNGSVQALNIPQDLKELYKTVWEMSMKDIIDMSRHRGYFLRSIAVVELVHGRTPIMRANVHAFLRMEKWLKNRNVLFENQERCRCYQVHIKQRQKRTVIERCWDSAGLLQQRLLATCPFPMGSASR